MYHLPFGCISSVDNDETSTFLEQVTTSCATHFVLERPIQIGDFLVIQDFLFFLGYLFVPFPFLIVLLLSKSFITLILLFVLLSIQLLSLPKDVLSHSVRQILFEYYPLWMLTIHYFLYFPLSMRTLFVLIFLLSFLTSFHKTSLAQLVV